MKKITVFLEDEEISFSIDKYKIIYGNNYNKKYKLLKKIEQYINKQTDTEYNEYNFRNNKILLDNQSIHQNNSVFISINQYFDLDSDLKLGAKSLFLKYLEAKLHNIEFEDDFIFINNAINSLNLNYFDENINIEHDNLKLKFNIAEFSFKQIIKLIETELTKDDLLVNMYDLSYYEIVELQLHLINEIAKNNDKEYYVSFDINIDDKILKLIDKKINSNNVYLFIITNNCHTPKDINNYLFINTKTIDLADEIVMYDYVMNNLPFYVESKEEMVNIFYNYIQNTYTKEAIELRKIL